MSLVQDANAGAASMRPSSVAGTTRRKARVGPCSIIGNGKGRFSYHGTTPYKTSWITRSGLCGVNKYGQGTYDASGITALAEALKVTLLKDVHMCI